MRLWNFVVECLAIPASSTVYAPVGRQAARGTQPGNAAPAIQGNRSVAAVPEQPAGNRAPVQQP